MPQKKYLVTLSDEEREPREQLLHSGTHATRKVTRARILLKAAEGWQDSAIATALAVGRATSNALASALSKRGWGHWRSVRAPGPNQSWRRRQKRACLRKPVVTRRRGVSAGPCSCWPIVSSHSVWLSRMHMRVSGAS